MVTTPDCTSGCFSRYYDANTSDTAVPITKTAIPEIVVPLHGAKVDSIRSEDRVCLKYNLCVDKLKFDEIQKSDQVIEVDGVLAFGKIKENEQTNIVKELYDAKKIPEMIATF